MDQKYGEFAGVDNLHYATITADTALAYTPGTPVYLAPAASIAGSPEVANKTTYYDNVAANNYVTEGKTELTIVVPNIPASLAATLLGKPYDATTGRVYDTGKANPPMLALGFRFDKGTDGSRYYWYLKGNFSGGTEEAASKGADVDLKTYTLTYTAVSTTHTWTVDAEDIPIKRIYGDSSDTAFVATGWFSAVQVPVEDTP